MINEAYSTALKEVLQGGVYERVDEEDIFDRLSMGDSGMAFSNRVLLLAFIENRMVGCISSTYSPPWTPEGCGHWGLLVTDVKEQRKGVAKALV